MSFLKCLLYAFSIVMVFLFVGTVFGNVVVTITLLTILVACVLYALSDSGII